MHSLVTRMHVSSLCGLSPKGKRRYAVAPRFTRLRLCIGTARCETRTLVTGARALEGGDVLGNGYDKLNAVLGKEIATNTEYEKDVGNKNDGEDLLMFGHWRV